MATIYALTHSYDNADGEPEEKILGYFGTRGEAEVAVTSYVDLPGFWERPEGFLIEELKLGRLAWTDGFETVVGDEPFAS